MRRRLGPAVVSSILLGMLVLATQASSDVGASRCGGGTEQTVEVGIVKAVGCFTEATKEGATVYTAAWKDQGEAGVDLNGFVLNGPSGGGLEINAKTREVASVALSTGVNLEKAQLYSRNWPAQGQLTKIGQPTTLDFLAPEHSSLQLMTVRFGSNTLGNALAGLSPVGDVETPIVLEEDGKGSMDLSVLLAGAFTLKGHAQSVTIDLPTESLKGTHLDGFEIELEEIDTFKLITLNDFMAKYSASEHVIAGSATATFPFSGPGKKGIGFGVGFALEDGALTEIKGNVKGVKIPVGAPPGGFITGIGGGFKLKNESGNAFTLIVQANAEAEFGPEVPTPWGKVAPIEVNAGLQVGHVREELFFEIKGGVKIFRIPVGDVLLAIHSSGGVQFGVGLGVGFPCYCNKDTEPFYIGARVEGWVAKGKFQFEGSGRVALFGVKIFDGRVLVNDRAAGACWKVLGVDGGAVYVYGARDVKTFGIGCGLDDYKEKFPAGARLSAADGSRTIRLSEAEQVLEVRGAGGAPRFTMRSADGHRVVQVPARAAGRVDRTGFRNAVFVNEGENATFVVMPAPAGRWTVTPEPGSPPITDLKAGREAPAEHVEAEVRGHGRVRTLVWHSLNRAHTRLAFAEVMPDGTEIPILETGRAAGRKRFAVAPGQYHGTRQLRAVVIHGYGATQAPMVDSFRVTRPRPLRAPRHVSAWRDEWATHVRWRGVPQARSYLVQVALRRHGKLATSYVRHVPAKRRGVVIPVSPSGGTAYARVFAVNFAGRLGKAAVRAFQTTPPPASFGKSIESGAASVKRHGGRVLLTTRCPGGGHCQMQVELRVAGHRVYRTHFQQTPNTFNRLWLTPRTAAARKALREGARFRVRVHGTTLEDERAGASAVASGGGAG
jgi:hypothetical protein